MAVPYCAVEVRVSDLNSGYYPIAGADIFALNMSARTDCDGHVDLIAERTPEHGVMICGHRIGYKPFFAYTRSLEYQHSRILADVNILMTPQTTYEIASYYRVSRIFPTFDLYLPNSNYKSALNWDDMGGYVTDLNNYSIIDPWNRGIYGDEADMYLSDFCTYSQYTPIPHSSSGFTSAGTTSWYCDGLDNIYTLSYYGYDQFYDGNGFSGSWNNTIGGGVVPSNDFVIGLPVAYDKVQGTSYENAIFNYSFQVTNNGHVIAEKNPYYAQISWSDNGRVANGDCEIRITGATPGTDFFVDCISQYRIISASMSIPTINGKIDEQYLWVHNVPDDYWCCYDRNFSQDIFKHYNGPFGPVYH